jgi:uncharacterized DUF497 family protein
MFEWDSQKRVENFQAHGVDFVRAAKMFDNPVLEREDTRRFGERRFVSLGHVGGFFMVVSWKPNGTRKRLLSAWRADHEDESIYCAAIPAPARDTSGHQPGRRALPPQPRRGLLANGQPALPNPRPPNGKGPSRP